MLRALQQTTILYFGIGALLGFLLLLVASRREFAFWTMISSEVKDADPKLVILLIWVTTLLLWPLIFVGLTQDRD